MEQVTLFSRILAPLLENNVKDLENNFIPVFVKPGGNIKSEKILSSKLELVRKFLEEKRAAFENPLEEANIEIINQLSEDNFP